jgi:hypothetical protein
MTGKNKPAHLVAHLQFFQPNKAKQKTAKEPPSQRTPNRHEMIANNHVRKEERSANSTYKKLAVE